MKPPLDGRELFIFEVPLKGLAKLEVEVTNLSAKAGKGEVVGVVKPFPSVGHGPSILKKVASIRVLHQVSDVENFGCYPLRKRVSCTAGLSALVLLFILFCGKDPGRWSTRDFAYSSNDFLNLSYLLDGNGYRLGLLTNLNLLTLMDGPMDLIFKP
ncbi:hypothetical protein HAX54_045894 [Datura stramonium]|uniref:Uncharacterized protein n=1 Tax=Datura stramonium TaxID=4076 RepID=A0ABS8SQM6_DATST|nr:hypothetical protein [Datura stramonium]